jgi:hypothetical protein
LTESKDDAAKRHRACSNRIELGVDRMHSEAVNNAAARFEQAWATAVKDKMEYLSPPNADMIEVHEAALELIAVTGTASLHEALEVLGSSGP